VIYLCTKTKSLPESERSFKKAKPRNRHLLINTTGGNTLGYTQYWKPTGEFTTNQFAELRLNAAKIIEVAKQLPYKIGIDTDGSNDTTISINGCVLNKDPEEIDEYELEELTHETFELFANHVSTFNFCKTARKPYDIVVVACLIAAEAAAVKAGFTMNLSTDGEIENWQKGMELFAQALPDVTLPDLSDVFK
jgi:hypothetical protein